MNAESPIPIPDSERTPADTRKARVERLRAMVAEIFPGEESQGLRDKIERSFDVPQVGEYHTEGAFMDSHLDLIVENVEAVARGEFPEEIPAAIRKMLSRAVHRDTKAVKKYVFEHDIAKGDSLTLVSGASQEVLSKENWQALLASSELGQKAAKGDNKSMRAFKKERNIDEAIEADGQVVIKHGEVGRPVSWEEWQALLASSELGRKVLAGDEAALKAFCEERGIVGISYYQALGERQGSHGKTGAERLRSLGVSDESVLNAIEKHEVAFQFASKEEEATGKILARADRFRTHFGGLSSEDVDFVFLASYVDTMSSIRKSGKPNLTGFLAMAASFEKSKSLQALESRLAGGSDLDMQKFQKAWSLLRNSYEALPTSAIDAAEMKLRAECKLSGYDVERLRVLVEPLVASETFTRDESDRLLEMAEKDPQRIGRVFGSKMKVLGDILRQAQSYQ